MKHSLLLFSILVLTLISCAQKKLYNLEGYDEVKRGEIEVDGALITNTVFYKIEMIPTILLSCRLKTAYIECQ